MGNKSNNSNKQNVSPFFQKYDVIKANSFQDYFYLNQKNIANQYNNVDTKRQVNVYDYDYDSQFIGCRLRVMSSQQLSRVENVLKSKLNQQKNNKNYSVLPIKQYFKQSNSWYCSSETNFLTVFDKIIFTLKDSFVQNRQKGKIRYTEQQIVYVMERIATALYFLDQIHDPAKCLTLESILIESDNSVFLEDPLLYNKQMQDQNLHNERSANNPTSYSYINSKQIQIYYSPEELANLQTFNSEFDRLNSQLFKLGVICLQMRNLNQNYSKKIYSNDRLNNKRINWKILNQELQVISQNKLRQKIKLLTSTKGSYRKKIYEIINRENEKNPEYAKFNLKQMSLFIPKHETFNNQNSTFQLIQGSRYANDNNKHFLGNTPEHHEQSSSKAYSNDMIKIERQRKYSQDVNVNLNGNQSYFQSSRKYEKVNDNQKMSNELSLYEPIKLTFKKIAQNQPYYQSSYQGQPKNNAYYNSLSTNSTYSSHPGTIVYPQKDKIIQFQPSRQNYKNQTAYSPYSTNYSQSYYKNHYFGDIKNETNFRPNTYQQAPRKLDQLCLNRVQSKHEQNTYAKPYSFSFIEKEQQQLLAFQKDRLSGFKSNRVASSDNKQKQPNSFYTFKKINFQNNGSQTQTQTFSKNNKDKDNVLINQQNLRKYKNLNGSQDRENLDTLFKSFEQKIENKDIGVGVMQKKKIQRQNLSKINLNSQILQQFKKGRTSQAIISSAKKTQNISISPISHVYGADVISQSSPSKEFLINIIQKQSPKSMAMSKSQKSNHYSDMDIDSPIPFIQDNKSQRGSLNNSSQKKYFQSGEELEYVIEQYQNGSKYQGYKKEGVRHGHGKFYYQEGSVYDGQWKGNQMHGYGKLYYSNGDLAYEGQWFEDQFNGLGKVYNDKPTMLDGSFDYSNFNNLEQQWIYYDGQLRKDAKQGHGKIMLQNGQWFQGEFKQDRINGEGVFCNLYGDNIKGTWQDSILIKKDK